MIPPGHTFTIPAGMHLEFNTGRQLINQGQLNLNGTDAAPITLTSAQANKQGNDWAGIVTQGPGALSNANYTVVEYAKNAFGFIAGASGTLDHATLRNNQNGLFVSGGLETHDPTQDSRPVMHHSNLYDNSNYHYSATDFADATVTLDAQTNWWGTTDAARIERDIYDQQDDANSPVIDWQREQKAIAVTSTATTPITVAADRVTGLIPLTVNLTINNPNNLAITHIAVDFDGDGVAEISTTDPAVPLTYEYSKQGGYIATVSITESNGLSLSSKLAVIANQSIDQVDTEIRAVFDSMLDHLRAMDIPGAMHHIIGSSAERYQRMFEILGDRLPAAADSLGTLTQGTIGKNYAEFIIEREKSGTKYGYPVLFLKSDDGKWRIVSM